jgi:hypothetical protein
MLHIHEKFSKVGPEGYSGLVIAEWELPNGHAIEVLADSNNGVFWLNRFDEDGVCLDIELDRPATYDEAIVALVKAGLEAEKDLHKN